MTSDRECYVYLQLPGSMEVVTCGLYRLDRTRAGAPVGRFVYGRRYRERADAVPLDPVHLPVAATTFTTARLEGMFGALRDAAPDAWGRRVIERVRGASGLDELDYLLYAPEDRAGALSFGRSVTPPAPVHEFNRVLRLAELREAARLIEEDVPGRELPQQLLDLVEPGTSLGGARPKNVVEDGAGLWVAKFPMRGDRWNNAVVEAAMLALAGRCGIRVPETRVEPVRSESVLLVRRFDRERVEGGWLRHRMVSALTVLDAEESPTDRTGWSYVLLADELRRWSSRPRQDRAELFRRMVFNALISNTDDHPRNHAVIAPGREWVLAPAYDLTPNPMRSVERRDLAMECGRWGRVARCENLVSEAPRFGVSRDEAGAVIDEMREIVALRWRDEVRAQGGSEADCERIAPAFLYPGLDYTADRG